MPSSIIALTSISPKLALSGRAKLVVDSWLDVCTDVISLNLPGELLEVAAAVPRVAIARTERNEERHFGRPCVRIYDILQQATDAHAVYMLINSDILISDHGRLIQRAAELAEEGSPTVGIRYNYRRNQHWMRRERFGLDAFIFTKSMIEGLPDTRLAIGIPHWDYWLPWVWMRQKRSLFKIDSPCFYHQDHRLNWSSAQWFLAAREFADHYPDSGYSKIAGEDWYHTANDIHRKIMRYASPLMRDL